MCMQVDFAESCYRFAFREAKKDVKFMKSTVFGPYIPVILVTAKSSGDG